MMNYYDTVLLAIPTVFTAVTAVFLATGTGVTTAVPAAAFPVLLVIAHAIFVRAPTEVTDRSRAVSSAPRVPQSRSGDDPST